MVAIQPLRCQGWQSSTDLCRNLADYYVINKQWLPRYPSQGKYMCEEHMRVYRDGNGYVITKYERN